jgi:AmmeMemoRadiSam system protein B
MGPHAGYVYSGAILGETYAAVELPPTLVLMCPNHTGRGVRQSLWASGSWSTPLGPAAIDDELTGALLRDSSLQPDLDAHRFEHAIEVHLPFALARRPDIRIVPITLARLSFDECEALGASLAEAIRAHEREVLVCASTDMSHYLDAETARRLDMLALEAVQAFDPRGLHETVEAHEISMCGYVPTTVAMVAARALGATSAHLVRYGNSGDASGDYQRVVGYAGAIFD